MKPAIALTLPGLMLMALVTACSTAAPKQPEEAAVRDYIAAGDLETTNRIRSYERDSSTTLNERFVLYRTRERSYLFEFARRCTELTDPSRVTPDRRYDHDNLRAGVDTLRGCIIAKIYPLTDAQAIELRNLGDAPGEEHGLEP